MRAKRSYRMVRLGVLRAAFIGLSASACSAMPDSESSSQGAMDKSSVSSMRKAGDERVLTAQSAAERVTEAYSEIRAAPQVAKATLPLSSGDSFMVMSINIRIPGDSGENSWENRLPRIAKLIDDWHPAIIGLQEVRDATNLDLIDALSHDYWWVHVRRGGDDDDEGPAIYVDTTRFTVEDSFYRDVTHDQRDNECEPFVDKDTHNRPIQAVRLVDRQTGRHWYFYNTHYAGGNSCERRGTSSIFADYIAGRIVQDSKIIATGDFNDGINADGTFNASYNRFVSESGLISAYDALNPLGSAYAFGTGNGNWSKTYRYGKMIDHVFVSVSASDILYSAVDRNMFTSTNARVFCPVVDSAGHCTWLGVTYPVSSLRLYSDHWAVVTELAP